MTDPPEAVEAWFDDHLSHSMTAVGRTICAAIPRAVPDAIESIKWQAPNLARRDDFATLRMRRPGILQVILHTGAKPKPKPDLAAIRVDELRGRLRWAGHNRAIVTLTSPDEINDVLPEFEELIATWVEQQT